MPLDPIRFGTALAATMNLYGRPVSPDVLELFAAALRAYETEDVLRALHVHLLDPDVGQFPPKPADLVRRIAGNNSSRAALAWSKVTHAIRTVGGWQSVVFDDPLIHACVADMGGWLKLCDTAADDLPFRARDFERLYLGYRQREAIPAYPPALTGRAEAYNGAKGYQTNPPLLLGDTERARLVHQGGSNQPRLARVQLPSFAPP